MVVWTIKLETSTTKAEAAVTTEAASQTETELETPHNDN